MQKPLGRCWITVAAEWGEIVGVVVRSYKNKYRRCQVWLVSRCFGSDVCGVLNQYSNDCHLRNKISAVVALKTEGVMALKPSKLLPLGFGSNKIRFQHKVGPKRLQRFINIFVKIKRSATL